MTYRTSHSVLIAIALVVAAAFARPHRAAAQYTPPDYGPWPAVVVAAPPSLFVLGMTIADSVSFAENKPFDDVLSVGDLVTGGIVSAGSLIFLGVALNSAINGDSTDPVPFALAGGIGLALGVYELAHGIWSLQHNDDRPRSTPALAVTPLPHGAALSIGGEF